MPEGFQDVRYDRRSRRVVGGVMHYVGFRNSDWVHFLDYGGTRWWDGMGYAFPRWFLRKEMRALARAVRTSPANPFAACLVSTSAAGFLGS